MCVHSAVGTLLSGDAGPGPAPSPSRPAQRGPAGSCGHGPSPTARPHVSSHVGFLALTLRRPSGKTQEHTTPQFLSLQFFVCLFVLLDVKTPSVCFLTMPQTASLFSGTNSPTKQPGRPCPISAVTPTSSPLPHPPFTPARTNRPPNASCSLRTPRLSASALGNSHPLLSSQTARSLSAKSQRGALTARPPSRAEHREGQELGAWWVVWIQQMDRGAPLAHGDTGPCLKEEEEK